MLGFPELISFKQTATSGELLITVSFPLQSTDNNECSFSIWLASFYIGPGTRHDVASAKPGGLAVQSANHLQVRLPPGGELAHAARDELRARRPQTGKHFGWQERPKRDLSD